ncbi:MAG: sulfite exporter TauE/SafE family protein [Pseudomonadota bacterium]
MFDSIAAALALSQNDILVLILICFVAGMVRGFSGFALSACVMASGALILPPVQLIPICFFLELAASVLMVRGGWKDANRRVAIALAIGSTVGVPFGLILTTNVDAATSQLFALILIAALAMMQLARIRFAFLATKPGLYGAGVMAGIATGIASVGGMVVALYVLARQAPAREMRGSLVLFLFIGSCTTAVSLLLFGVMDSASIVRGLVFAIPAGLGVVAGKLLFRPSWEPYYKPFCLCLLVALAVWGILRLVLGV